MSFTRLFGSLESFGRFLEERTAAIPLGLPGVAAASAEILERRAKALYGDSTKLADLAQATQDERTRLGYTPNDPLLRDGTLLRDSLEKFSDENSAAIGSDEPIHAFHEYGYINWRTGNPVPPRPVFRITLVESEPEVMALLDESIGVLLGFEGVVTPRLQGEP